MAKKSCDKCTWVSKCSEDEKKKGPCIYYVYKKREVEEAKKKEQEKIEHEIQNDIIEYLVSQDFKVLRVNGVSRGNICSYHLHSKHDNTLTVGFPDLLTIKDSRCIGFEVKTGTGKVSEDQYKVKDMLTGDMLIYYVSSVDQVRDLIGRVFDRL